ncbi:MAG: Asp-tRNA(Asn)/Glu-tRNA(Gln) amidotransferase subunit GatB [Candidatus Eisenbacteria bacterium]|nr:Asp-tRNA(Asn)/Glu-tRNA(Gln) amidotransferase subunit GatB [Candidatus Eisenbacteria bacterium]
MMSRVAHADHEAVIGLELHVQLQTASKLFCGCSTRFGAAPNTQVCPVCLGYPGALPVVNEKAVEMALRLAAAAGARSAAASVFARKSYFYPDLPKGYQISQYDRPLATGGAVRFTGDGGERDVPLIRIHLEEDAGKSLHGGGTGEETRIDLNRCGVPLAEVVTEPVLRSPAEARACVAAVRRLVQYLDVSDGNMEEGSLRCDANVSLRRRGEARLGVPVEIKNLNSLRNLERGLEAAIGRRLSDLARGETAAHRTLLYDEATGEVRVMRAKESAPDYRYFPEPDLPPLVLDRDALDAARAALPELPWERRARLRRDFALAPDAAAELTRTREEAEFFEACLVSLRAELPRHDLAHLARTVAAWTVGELRRVRKERGAGGGEAPVAPGALARLLQRIVEGALTIPSAKTVLEEMARSGRAADEIIAAEGLGRIGDPDQLRELVRAAFTDHPQQLAELRAGKEPLINFFVGRVMRAAGGRADPQLVRRIVQEEI